MITLAEQIAEAQRELALRKRCYPQGVKGGTLKAGDATYQLRAQEAIIRTLMQLDAEQRQLPLLVPAISIPKPATTTRDSCDAGVSLASMPG